MASPAAFTLETKALGVVLGGRPVLEGINFYWDGATRIAVLGANGAGKTVLLRALHGLVEPTTGSILWNGSPDRAPPQAMVFQRPVLLRRSAAANVEYALAVGGVARAERRTRARAALAGVGLADIAGRPARVMSGGEQQRVALARAWATEPRVLFLDEPTSSLDPAAASEVERVMGGIHGAGTALLFSTHHLGFARRAADEVLFIHAGRVTERTPADRFFDAPRSAQAAQFLEGELP